MKHLLNLNSKFYQGQHKTRTVRYRLGVAGTVLCLIVCSHVFAADRLDLDDTSIQGSRELPKVLYIVPWKKTRVGTLAGVSERASFETSMTTLDRDVFLQELKYYNILNGPEILSKK